MSEAAWDAAQVNRELGLHNYLGNDGQRSVVDLIPYSRFGRLRLADFAPSRAEVVNVGDWEFMDDRWVGEAVGGFTEFLRLEEEPEVVRSVALGLAALPRDVSAAILGAIGLPLEPGMEAASVEARLGRPDSVE